MATTTFTLNALELACGVTIADIQREVPRMMIRDGGATLVVDGTLSPATGSALARLHFRDNDYTARLDTSLGLAIYTLKEEEPPKLTPCYCDYVYHRGGC